MYEKSHRFSKCCFCLPLGRGLLTFGYVRLALDILMAADFIRSYYWQRSIPTPGVLTSYIEIAILFLIDAIFTILFIVASHKKNRKLFRISNIYAVTWVCLVVAYQAYEVISVGLRVPWIWSLANKFGLQDLLTSTSIVLTVASVQIYVILLTRSEMKKLKNLRQNMIFVNKMAESESLCVRVDT